MADTGTSGVSNELVQALGNLNSELGPFWELLHTIAYLIGAGLVIAGLFVLSRGQGGIHFAKGAASVVVGLLLLGLPSVMDMGSQTIFQENAPKGLQEVQGKIPGNGPETVFIKVAVGIVMLVGLYGCITGICMLKSIGEGSGGSKYHAATFVVAGIICINILTFIKMLGASIGGVFLSTVQRLFGS